MLTKEENAYLCQVGAGTPMGANLRRYWWPVLPAGDLVGKGRACTPHRIRLLGEDLVAFRGEDGVVRLVDERCPHRGASLALGMVEDCGIRCLYHGWKLNETGVLEAPNIVRRETGRNPFSGIKTNRYSAREAGGIIWAYIGDSDDVSPFPDYRFFEAGERNLWVSVQYVDANFVQVVETSVDPAHVAFLHADAMAKVSAAIDPSTSSNIRNQRAPKIELERTDFGFRMYAVREQDAEHRHVRPTLFVAPATIFIPRSPQKSQGGLLTVVPIDDTHSMQMVVMWDEENDICSEPVKSEMLATFGMLPDTLAGFGLDFANRSRVGKPSRENCFLQDREAIARGDSVSGLGDFAPEDLSIAMSQGAIADRSVENLVESDIGVVEFRRTLINSARAVEKGSTAFATGGDVDSYAICAHEYIVCQDEPWRPRAPVNQRLVARKE